MNCKWTDSGPQPLQDIGISFAVAVDGGVITPVVQGADNLTVRDISLVVQVCTCTVCALNELQCLLVGADIPC